MKYIILPLILWIVFLSTYHKSFSASESEMIAEIQKVESDFQAQYWVQKCAVQWVNVSLWAVMYGLAIQEWWWKDGTLWDRTNNRWSLHWTMNIKKPVKFVKWDWTKTRPVYKTAYDWLYEKARMITHKKVYNNCDIWYKQLYAYIVWPNAKPNAIYSWNRRYTNSQWVNNRVDKLLSNAKKFDKIETDQIKDKTTASKTTASTKDVKHINTKCMQKATVSTNQYLQIDNEYWHMESQIDLVKWDKVFICTK